MEFAEHRDAQLALTAMNKRVVLGRVCQLLCQIVIVNTREYAVNTCEIVNVCAFIVYSWAYAVKMQ